MKQYEIGDKITLEVKRAKEGCLGCFFRDTNAENCHAYCSPTTILVQTDEHNQVSRKAIDWEQRRYEIAKATIAGSLIEPLGAPPQQYAEAAIGLADALIEELKRQANDSQIRVG